LPFAHYLPIQAAELTLPASEANLPPLGNSATFAAEGIFGESGHQGLFTGVHRQFTAGHERLLAAVANPPPPPSCSSSTDLNFGDSLLESLCWRGFAYPNPADFQIQQYARVQDCLIFAISLSE
jgi:hypothetical protein